MIYIYLGHGVHFGIYRHWPLLVTGDQKLLWTSTAESLQQRRGACNSTHVKGQPCSSTCFICQIYLPVSFLHFLKMKIKACLFDTMKETTADFTNTTGHNRTEIPSWTEDLLHLNQVKSLFLESKKMLISGITKYFLSTSHFSSTVLQVNTQQAPLIARGGWGGGGLGSCFCISCCSFRCAFLSCIQQQAH